MYNKQYHADYYKRTKAANPEKCREQRRRARKLYYKRHRRRCLDCARKWREENPEKAKASQKASCDARAQKGITFLANYLLTHPCVGCGETDIRILEFDHVQKRLKSVTELAYRNSPKLMKEIARCEVRCSNCHTRRHLKGTLSWNIREKVQLVARGDSPANKPS